MSDQDLPLFDQPPSGPACRMVASHRANTRAGYLAWRGTEDGLAVWELVQRKALAILSAANRAYVTGTTWKPPRISTKAIVEQVRAELRLEVNNSYTAMFADDLVVRYPELLECIERRKRKAA